MSTELLRKIEDGVFFSEEEMVTCMSEIMDGQWTDAQISSFLTALSARGETVEEITGAARVMREKALPISAPDGAVDCCGTGGDKSGTYNISTAVAIVAAACGVPVAKHGNRSASSKSGAADVLESLGINLDVPQDKLEGALQKFNFAFLMAPNHHKAMKYVMPVRKALGVRTIFNILGPLANPAKTKFQLLGVYDRALVVPMANVLKNLGTQAAWVVHGSDGLDEITTTGETYVAKLKDGQITEKVMSPEDFGLARSNLEDLLGGLPAENAKALREILSGVKNAYRDIVVANTAAVLVISGRKTNLNDAVDCAAQAIDSGDAMNLLNDYAAYTQMHADKV